MIRKALQLIVEQLSQAINRPDEAPDVRMANVANIDGPNQNNLVNSILVSLVNIEEESTLKNINAGYTANNRVHHVYPPVYLNLYILFSANYDNYENSLGRLSDVIRFFQGHRVFTINNASLLHDELNISHPDEQSLSLQLELYTMTFEQINHLWGSLGGKQMPFVMYKVRLIEITAREIVGENMLIEQIHGYLSATNRSF